MADTLRGGQEMEMFMKLWRPRMLGFWCYIKRMDVNVMMRWTGLTVTLRLIAMWESVDFNKVQGICQLESAFRHMQMVPNIVAQEDFTSGF